LEKHIRETRELSAEGTEKMRETRGAFFTPAIWADKSKAYLADVFGPDWQDEYYIWDCAAGTGNLLAGLTNKNNIWASDIDLVGINAIRELIGGRLHLLHTHIFQFDFLNDDFKKLPEMLQKILRDPEKRRKLIVYINPPYAEAASAKTVKGVWKHKAKVSTKHAIHDNYRNAIGRAANEVFSLFMMRIADTLSGSNLAIFSTVKYVNSSNFAKFREKFSAQFQKGFICPSNTFDNVAGKFPIGFLIWKLAYNGCQFKFPKSVNLDVFNADGKRAPKKKFYNGGNYINTWLTQYAGSKDLTFTQYAGSKDSIGVLNYRGADFQQQKTVYIANKGSKSLTHFFISNIRVACIYFAVRLCIEPAWINDRDQFLFPNDNYKTDTEFQHDCLAFTLFHGQNRISCTGGVNHWIPFTEKDVDAKEKFASNFMSFFLKEKTFSPEAQAVLSAGKALWKYFHEKTKDSKTVSVNASFYDIREFFQGRKDSGAMNAKSADETYTALLKTLRDALKALAKKIEPKVYQYGFLKK
jgi:hypothetical protein